MSKKGKTSRTAVDFDIGIGEVIPATQEAYREEGFSTLVRKEERASIAQFKQSFLGKINAYLKHSARFPTDGEVFVFIVQYFTSGNEYRRRDIDNMAKTILDLLKGQCYRDDSQVKTLLVAKKAADQRVTQNFAYIAIKILGATQDVDALKISGLERAVTLFQELRSKGVL